MGKLTKIEKKREKTLADLAVSLKPNRSSASKDVFIKQEHFTDGEGSDSEADKAIHLPSDAVTIKGLIFFCCDGQLPSCCA